MTTKSDAISYTGRVRRKQTRWSVRFADHAAKWLITVGGIGTILAVSLVFLFLLAVAVPLFLPARVTGEQRLLAPPGPVLAEGADEFRRMWWTVSDAGELRLVRLDNGAMLARRAWLEGGMPTAISWSLGAADIAVAVDDGTIRFGTMGFHSEVVSAREMLPEVARSLQIGELVSHDEGLWERTGASQWRRYQLANTWSGTVPAAGGVVRRLDHLMLTGQDGLTARSFLIVYATAEGSCMLSKVEEQENQFTGEKTLSSENFPLPVNGRAGSSLLRLLIAGRGDNVYAIWTSGLVQRLDIRDLRRITVAEEVETVSTPGGELTACGLLLGRETLMLADSSGGLRAWFRTRGADRPTRDGLCLTMVHDLSVPGSGVTTMRGSERGRTLAVGYEDGTLRVFQVTTEKCLLTHRIADRESLRGVAIAPKEDGLLAVTDKTLWMAEFEPRHPEATWSSLFRPVWYEGYDQPQYMWQSSYSTSAPEMKLSLVPLVFGTLKATFYTMLFGAPLALLAAIYTSEFMHPRVRGWVKPAIEMMASLPSVVLGFLAALVFAPLIESHVVATIAVLYVAPFLYLFSAHLWQALPQRLLVRWARIRLVLLAVPLPAGIIASLVWEPVMEQWLFAGDIHRWLDGQIGRGTSAWLLLWLPLCALVTTVVVATQINPLLRGFISHCTRGQYVLLGLLKFALATAFTVGLATAIAWLLDSAGWDPRGSYVATYDPRNALIVGAVMGFAVIPIIFTLADDALSTVPQHLRSASLGCGATPWQTALRVVVPTAMSGLFSALMIGLGRAVGETMIVLMAGGNTPVMEWNVFNGFRTLSANIATELPEAVRDSTHYRTLFLAALTLFLLTFCLNTVAELVRLRFRRRAYQL